MCSCFDQTLAADPLRDLMRLTAPVVLPPKKRIRPTDRALVIGAHGQWRGLRFGWPVDWSPQPLINGRQESLRHKMAFRRALERRVVVPAAFYVEWRDPPQGNDRKQAMRLGPEHPFAEPLWMAALWDGDEAFCLITTRAQGPAAQIHHRMPVLLTAAQARDGWLSADPYATVAHLVEGEDVSAVAAALTVAPLEDRHRRATAVNDSQGRLL